jgi:predicted Na+-dependent transporter
MVRLLAAAVVLALVLPVSAGWRDVAQFFSNAAVFLLFFLNGLRLPRHEVLVGLTNHRLLWPLVLWCFGAMALAGWLVWHAGTGWMPPLLALGFLYLGCLPIPRSLAAMWQVQWWRRRCLICWGCSSPRRCSPGSPAGRAAGLTRTD